MSLTIEKKESRKINLPQDRNLTWADSFVSRKEREQRNKHCSFVIWLTGLSGSGKTTIARNLERRLFESGYHSVVLDGDNVRHGLNSDLGFTDHDREENIRRIGETAKLFANAGMIAISAFISPFESDRERARSILSRNDFVEIYLNCPLEVCERRDTKGLYRQARSGLIKNFTGIDSPYETPQSPELSINTAELDIDESVNRIVNFLSENNYL